MEQVLASRGHSVDLVDPVQEKLPLLTRPHFAYPAGESPHDALAERLGAAQVHKKLICQLETCLSSKHCACPRLGLTRTSTAGISSSTNRALNNSRRACTAWVAVLSHIEQTYVLARFGCPVYIRLT